MADQPKPPLWRVMHSVFVEWTTYPPQPPHRFWAALIRALADWLVTEEGQHLMGTCGIKELFREERQRLRQLLLAEADRAEAGVME